MIHLQSKYLLALTLYSLKWHPISKSPLFRGRVWVKILFFYFDISYLPNPNFDLVIPPNSKVPYVQENLNSRGDLEKQNDREMLVYSWRPTLKNKKDLTLEASTELEPKIALEPYKSEIPNINLPIALRKQTWSCTLYHISKFISYNALSIGFCTFTSNFDNTEVAKNIQKALNIANWRKVVMEEMRAPKDAFTERK